MTRHQRRKASAAKSAAKARQEIVRQNLSNPVETVRIRGAQISTVYANSMDVARGRGTTAGGFKPPAMPKPAKCGPFGYTKDYLYSRG